MSTAELQAIIAENAKSIRDLRDSQAETDRQMKATDQRIKELSSLFTVQWGKLIEALVHPGCVSLFRSRGITVNRASAGQEWFDDNGKKVAEVDVFLVNGGEDVAVEVKTTCLPKHIDQHLKRLAKLKELRPEYQNGTKKLYGAVAALKFNSESDTYARNKGLYVLKSTDGIVTIDNPEDFKPISF